MNKIILFALLACLFFTGYIVFVVIINEPKCIKHETFTVCQERTTRPVIIGKMVSTQIVYRDVSCDEDYDREIKEDLCVKWGEK